MKSLYLSQRFFGVMGTLIFLFFLGFGIELLFPVTQVALLVFAGIFLFDLFLLYRAKKPVSAKRDLPELLSLGDTNKIVLQINNRYPFAITATLIDELPYQLQERDFKMKETLAGGQTAEVAYTILPDERGEYRFGRLQIFATTLIGLAVRRISAAQPNTTQVYPSVVQMKKYELIALSRISTLEGIKKLRRIGHNYEFEQIRSYVIGDDIRSINWKATGKKHALMVNQYQDERAQQVYMIIDKSRRMELRFNKMRYLDYAVNSALVMANIALKKYDKAGLITFSDKIGASLKADRSKVQLRRILEQLYREKPSDKEADYDLLMHITRKMLYGRALILLYTNFETMETLERIIPYLRQLNRDHLLVVIFFEDQEIAEFSMQGRHSTFLIYQQVLAGAYRTRKMQIRARLQKLGIQTILTTPKKLSVDTLNKYLELKSRGLI